MQFNLLDESVRLEWLLFNPFDLVVVAVVLKFLLLFWLSCWCYREAAGAGRAALTLQESWRRRLEMVMCWNRFDYKIYILIKILPMALTSFQGSPVEVLASLLIPPVNPEIEVGSIFIHFYPFYPVLSIVIHCYLFSSISSHLRLRWHLIRFLRNTHRYIDT